VRTADAGDIHSMDEQGRAGESTPEECSCVERARLASVTSLPPVLLRSPAPTVAGGWQPMGPPEIRQQHSLRSAPLPSALLAVSPPPWGITCSDGVPAPLAQARPATAADIEFQQPPLGPAAANLPQNARPATATAASAIPAPPPRVPCMSDDLFRGVRPATAASAASAFSATDSAIDALARTGEWVCPSSSLHTPAHAPQLPLYISCVLVLRRSITLIHLLLLDLQTFLLQRFANDLLGMVRAELGRSTSANERTNQEGRVFQHGAAAVASALPP